MRSVGLKPGETVAVAGAAGGVGTIAVQLAKRAGAHVLGMAGAANDGWLAAQGVIPVHFGDGLADRLAAAAPGGRIDAFLDFIGSGYVAMAVEQLRIAPKRVDSIIDFTAIEKFKTQSAGSAAAFDIAVLVELAGMIEAG